MIYRLGWKKDIEDARDFKFTLKALQPSRSVYLAHRFKMPSVYDQGNLGSCTAQAVAFLVHFNLLNNLVQTKGAFIPSRLFIYYYERFLDETINVDAGSQLRTGIKVVSSFGAPSEDLWPYNIDLFTNLPSDRAIRFGLRFKALRYERIDNTNKELLVNALMQGYPICFGTLVFYSFFSDYVVNTGKVPNPQPNEEVMGGHAMAIVGYRQEDDSFIVRNSWGKNWGQGGYCRIPASYITNSYYASDFWTITSME